VTTVFEKPNGFCGFFSLFSTALQPPWSPASRALKTRKPGPEDQVSNTDYPSEASPKSGSGWWVGADLNCLSFRGGFTVRIHCVYGRPLTSTQDQNRHPLGHFCPPTSILVHRYCCQIAVRLGALCSEHVLDVADTPFKISDSYSPSDAACRQLAPFCAGVATRQALRVPSKPTDSSNPTCHSSPLTCWLNRYGPNRPPRTPPHRLADGLESRSDDLNGRALGSSECQYGQRSGGGARY
jgi:hypothetical protein